MDDFVQVKVPYGTLIEPKDSLRFNDEIYTWKLYNKKYEIENRDTIIDVGAHVGVFTVMASSKAMEGSVLAVEPHPLNYKLLEYNVGFNKLNNVITKNIALSSYIGVTKLYLVTQAGSYASGAHSIIFQKSDEYLDVPVKTVDKLVEEEKIEKVDMIKIDVEGAELEVLKGAKKTLRKNNVHLSIAAYHTPKEVEKVSKFLLRMGYDDLTNMNNFLYAKKSIASFRKW